MKKAGFTAEQIVGILQELASGGGTTKAVARKHGATDQAIYRW